MGEALSNLSNLRPKKIIVFASGRGSNFQALATRAKQGGLSSQICGLVANVEGCGALEVAREFEVPSICVPHAKLTREDHETRVAHAIEDRFHLSLADPDVWIVLAGYMRLFSASFITRLTHSELAAARVINIHPSLLPAFPGVDGYGQALRYGVKVTGVTVHLVTAELDSGPVVMQKPVPVRDDDTVESLQARGLKAEHEIYSDALNALVERAWRVEKPEGFRARVVFQ